MDLVVKVQNFKSIRRAKLRIAPGLTVLIGPNGSGKTCVLSAMRFVRDLVRHGVARAVAYAGGPLRAYHRGTETIHFAIEVDYGERLSRRRRRPARLTWSFWVSQKGGEALPRIARESLAIDILSEAGSPRRRRVFQARVKHGRKSKGGGGFRTNR